MILWTCVLQLPAFENGDAAIIDISRRFMIVPTMVYRYLSIYPDDMSLVGKNMSTSEFVNGIEMNWNYLLCKGKFIATHPILREKYMNFLLRLKSSEFNCDKILKDFSSSQYIILNNMNDLISSGGLGMDVVTDIEECSLMDGTHQISVINLELITSTNMPTDISKFLFHMLIDSADRIFCCYVKDDDMINWIQSRLKRQFGGDTQCQILDILNSWVPICDMPDDEYLVRLNNTYELTIAVVKCGMVCQMVENIPSTTKGQKMHILNKINK